MATRSHPVRRPRMAVAPRLWAGAFTLGVALSALPMSAAIAQARKPNIIVITGKLPIRTGLTTVGQARATIGIPDEAPTIATALKALGYETGQFGKNHLGDSNRYLPTVHGGDEIQGGGVL
jgi:hypothetical protein